MGVSALDFNTTLSEIVVQNPGFRYSIPAKVNLYGGRAYDTNVSYVFGRQSLRSTERMKMGA